MLEAINIKYRTGVRGMFTKNPLEDSLMPSQLMDTYAVAMLPTSPMVPKAIKKWLTWTSGTKGKKSEERPNAERMVWTQIWGPVTAVTKYRITIKRIPSTGPLNALRYKVPVWYSSHVLK